MLPGKLSSLLAPLQRALRLRASAVNLALRVAA
jgi:hypothetical protein